jgi:8-oxo-dGTP pyrophosphatase MutT (NUDIX family)
LLLTDGLGVLLQHRAEWTHEGGTWAVPGGARDSHETPIEAALREAGEESSLDPRSVDPVAQWLDEHGGWSYTTVVAVTSARAAVEPLNAESTALRWWALDEVAALELHRGFAAAWPSLRRLLETVTTANT